MIFDLHGKTLVSGVKRRTLGHGPRFQHAFHFETEVIMQAGGVVLLYDEAMRRLLLDFAGRLGRFFEAPLPFVFFEGHRSHYLTIEHTVANHPALVILSGELSFAKRKASRNRRIPNVMRAPML